MSNDARNSMIETARKHINCGLNLTEVNGEVRFACSNYVALKLSEPSKKPNTVRGQQVRVMVKGLC